MIKKRLSFLWIWIFLFALILTAFASCAKAPRREEGEPLAASDPAGWKNASGDPKERVIVLDPGHGYADPGALADGTAEKDVTLAIALSVREKLERYGFTVFMTREDDAIPDGEDGSYLLKPSMRASFAESLESFDLFLSFHADAFVSDLSVRGTRFYRYAGGKTGAAELCEIFKSGVYAALGGKVPSVIVMEESEAYTVLYKVKSAPSILIEAGFLTNEEDRTDLSDPAWQDAFAEAIASGVAKYFGKAE